MPMSWTGLVSGINRGLAGYNRGTVAGDQMAFERQQQQQELALKQKQAEREALLEQMRTGLQERELKMQEGETAGTNQYRAELTRQLQQRNRAAARGTGGNMLRRMNDRDLVDLYNTTSAEGNAPNDTLNQLATWELSRRTGGPTVTQTPTQTGQPQYGPPAPTNRAATPNVPSGNAADAWEQLVNSGMSPAEATQRVRAQFGMR